MWRTFLKAVSLADNQSSLSVTEHAWNQGFLPTKHMRDGSSQSENFLSSLNKSVKLRLRALHVAIQQQLPLFHGLHHLLEASEMLQVPQYHPHGPFVPFFGISFSPSKHRHVVYQHAS